MAAKMRLKRIGSKNSPAFRVVVTDSRAPRDGAVIEELGTYKPVEKNDAFKIDLDRAHYWIERGATPSETVSSLLRRAKKEAAQTA